MGVGGGREGSRKKKEDAGDGGGSMLVGPGKNMGQYTGKEAVAYSLMLLLRFYFCSYIMPCTTNFDHIRVMPYIISALLNQNVYKLFLCSTCKYFFSSE